MVSGVHGLAWGRDVVAGSCIRAQGCRGCLGRSGGVGLAPGVGAGLQHGRVGIGHGLTWAAAWEKARQAGVVAAVDNVTGRYEWPCKTSGHVHGDG